MLAYHYYILAEQKKKIYIQKKYIYIYVSFFFFFKETRKPDINVESHAAL